MEVIILIFVILFGLPLLLGAFCFAIYMDYKKWLLLERSIDIYEFKEVIRGSKL